MGDDQEPIAPADCAVDAMIATPAAKANKAWRRRRRRVAVGEDILVLSFGEHSLEGKTLLL
ncbi:hypothetical protein GCM10023068_10710 [Leifsonia shinshuensis]